MFSFLTDILTERRMIYTSLKVKNFPMKIDADTLYVIIVLTYYISDRYKCLKITRIYVITKESRQKVIFLVVRSLELRSHPFP